MLLHGPLLFLHIASIVSATYTCPFPICDTCLPAVVHDAPGIGFDLSYSYGTIAAHHFDGTVENVAVVQAEQPYQALIQRLTEGPPPPPPTSLDRWRRRLNKAIGRPATPDVGVLAYMFDAMKEIAPLGTDYVTVSYPYMAGITTLDINDALEHVGLRHWLGAPYFDPKHYGGMYPDEIDSVKAVFASSGRGLCKDYKNLFECWEEEKRMPIEIVLLVHFERNALLVAVSKLQGAFPWPRSDVWHHTDFDLGSNALRQEEPEDFRAKVRARLVEPLPRSGPPTVLLLSGESAGDPDLREAVREACSSSCPLATLDGMPGNDTARFMYEEARGSALYSRIRQEAPIGCRELKKCEERRKHETGLQRLGLQSLQQRLGYMINRTRQQHGEGKSEGQSHPTMDTKVGTTAPETQVLQEQSGKIESAFSDTKDVIPSSSHRKPTFKDYVFYAEAQRASDRHTDGQAKIGIADKLHNLALGVLPTAFPASDLGAEAQEADLTALDLEKVNAWRALRQASWAGAFYLCTTDILGPFNAPYAFRQNGYVPGTLLYVFMGGMAFYCGGLLWWLYVKLDSDRFPVKSYSDITERTAGKEMRVLVTWLVFIHMIVNVATTSLSAAQSLYQLAHGKICFVVAIVVWILVGCVLNQIRTLKRYSWLASSAIWLNILVIFLSMGFVAHSEPNYSAAKAAYDIPAGPVITQAFATYPFYSRINGVMNIVYAYGGATIFPQIIAEMRRPMDFLKAFSIAQAIIFTIYVVYGLVIYSLQGQFTLAVAFQGVSRYSWQTVGNVLNLISTVIAGGLYGNIGLKIFYQNVVERFLHGPSLLTKRGRLAWSATVIVFWWTGFVIGAAIPQVQTLSGMVGAATNMQFTYSFPTGFTFLYLVRLDATAEDEAYSPGGESGKIDTWRDLSRWKRALFGPRSKTARPMIQAAKWINFVFCLAALATAGLGIYGSGLSIAAAFDSSAATSFGCAAPV